MASAEQIAGQSSQQAGARAAGIAQASGLNKAQAAIQGANVAGNAYTDAFENQQRQQLAEQAQKAQESQFGVTSGQTAQQIANQQNQFNQQLAQQQAQFTTTSGLARDQFTAAQAQQTRDNENAFWDRIVGGGVGILDAIIPG